MTAAEMFEHDAIVCRAVRKQPGESIHAACLRIMRSPHGDPAWRVARIILTERPERPTDPWRRMARAAKAARRLLATERRSES